VTRLSQIIAIEKDTRTRAEQTAAFAYHQLQKPEPLTGISKAYTASDAEGEQQPSQGTRVQYTVEMALRSAASVTARYLDLLGTKERTDQTAVADVVIDGQVFIKDVPVLFLLGLERQLGEELVQARKLPTLSAEHEWTPFDSRGVSVTASITTKSTKKIPRNHVKAPATDKHPAQVEVYFEDTVVGTWDTRHFSGAITESRKQDIIERLTKLISAVKQAREEANTTAVTDFKVGDKVFGYIYGDGAGK
jgi:hypothetical protein